GGNDREPRAGGDDVIGCELARVGNRQTQYILSRPQRQRLENAVNGAARIDYRRPVRRRRGRAGHGDTRLDVDNGDLEHRRRKAARRVVSGADHQRPAFGDTVGWPAAAIEDVDRAEADLAGAGAAAGQRRLLAGRRAVHFFEVAVRDFDGGAGCAHLAAIEPHNPVAEPAHVPEIVRDDQHRLAEGNQLAQAFERPPPERRVADRQHLVDEHDVGIAVDGDAEAEPGIQAGRVAFHGRVYQLLDLGKLHDLVEAAVDVAAGQNEQAGDKMHVLAASELGMKSRAQLD